MKYALILFLCLLASRSYAETAVGPVAEAYCPACANASCFPAGGGYMVNYGHCGRRCRAALSYPWHCGYYYTPWGAPTALVVPPTAEKQYSMGWGVGNTRLTRIYQQYGRPYPGVAMGPGGRYLATPYWPSDTAQFGLYYVRGPW